MILASLFFATMSVCIKYASAHFGTFELVFYRGIIGMLFMGGMCRLQGVSLRTPVPMMHVWRSAIGVTSLSAWFYAIAHLPLAAFAGVLIAPLTLTGATMGSVLGLKAFAAAVLGGIGSLPGAVIGGLLIGLIETFWSAYFSSDYKDVAAFSILAIVLIFMPSGLLGRPDVEKV